MNYLPRLERIDQLHRDRVVALATALLAALVLLLVTDIAGSMSWYGLAATLVAASILLGNSDSFSGLLLLAAMIVQWLTSGMADGSWWVVPAAWLVLIAHVAVALVASGPDQAPIPRVILAVWVPRSLLVALATTVVAALTLLIEPADGPSMPYGAAVALIALIIAILVLIRLTGDSEQADTDVPRPEWMVQRHESVFQPTRPTKEHRLDD